MTYLTPLTAATIPSKRGGEEQAIIMTQDTIQKRIAYCWFVCQKCKSPEAAPAPLLIVPKQPMILCEDCLLQYSKIFSVEYREFV
jgi:hypothetical protein